MTISQELTKTITTIMEATGNEEYTKLNIWMTVKYIRDMPASKNMVESLSNTVLINTVNALATD